MRSNSIRTTVLAATALLAALSLTACNDNGSTDGAKSGSTAPATNAGTTEQSPSAAPDKGATNAPDADSGAGTTTGSAPKTTSQPAKNGGTSGKNTGGTTNSKTVTCTSANTKVTVSKVSRPVNHLLLTLTNSGSSPCYAYYAPKLRFDDAQAVFRILDSSQPQAVVTLDPGQSAYASIGLSGEGDEKNLHPSKNLGVSFSGRNPEGSTGSPANVKLPAGTTWGDNGFVTYWQSEMADALAY
ncbi:DUF4232 domain-containing protein [Streptomyces sp. NPDC058382]|uniref:DUF4232 domain-containing protein n=1 Tax=unclassified Streptomyces TaxID=2593676 RepID=UPI0036328074